MWAAMPPHPDPLGAMPMILEYTYLLREASQQSREVKVTHDGRSYQWQLMKSRYSYCSITKTVGEGIRAMLHVSFPPTGQVTIPGEITFQLDTDPATDPPLFTLTCTSTGGPATTVSWRRDGKMLSDDSTYRITSQVTDGTAAIYTHTLTVTGRLVGEYHCSVSNIRTPSGSSRSKSVGKRPQI